MNYITFVLLKSFSKNGHEIVLDRAKPTCYRFILRVEKILFVFICPDLTTVLPCPVFNYNI